MPFLTQGKTNWKFLLIVVVLAAIVGGGIWWWQWPSSPEEEMSGTEELSFKSLKEEVNYFINLGKEKTDTAICNDIKNIRQKAFCYGGVAGIKKNLRICSALEEDIETFREKIRREELTEKELKETFNGTELRAIRIDGSIDEYAIYPIVFGYCLGGAAISEDEPDICSWHHTISGSLWCHYLLAAVAEDVNICLEITKTPYEKAYCYRIVGEEPKVDLCKDVEQDYEGYRDMCYLGMAEIFEDPSLCDKMEWWNDLCEIEFQKDDSMCDDIEDIEFKEMCYSDIAKNLKDPSICEKIEEQEYKDECYKDLSTCDKIYDLTDRNQCYLAKARNTSDCEEVQGEEDKDSCYWNVAEYLKDVSICEELQNLRWKDGCYRSLARELDDVSMCEEIKGSIEKTVCYREMIDRAVVSKDISICNKIKDQRYKDWCSKYIAGTLTEVNICEKLQDALSQSYCYNMIAENIKDMSVCEKIQEQPIKDECYIHFATILADPNICKNTERLKDGCYGRVAKTLKDADSCYLIPSPSAVSGCIRNMAETLKDENICQKISALGLRDECYWALAKIKQDREICGLVTWDPDNQNKCYYQIDIILNLTEKGWKLSED